MQLLKLKNGEKGFVTYIYKHNHECRMYGIKDGVAVDLVYQFKDKMMVTINHREMVTIPKEIAKYIIVEVRK